MHIFAKIVGLALATAAIAAPAAAEVETFASFSPTGSARNLRWVGNAANATFYSTATATANVPGTANVRFSFLQPAISPFVTDVTARFTMAGTVSNTVATVSGNAITQSNIAGSFSFLSTAPITIGQTTFATGSNLLSGTFTLAQISGTRNGSSAGFSASTPTANITYTSDFLTFVQGSNYDLALALTSISPLLNATNASSQTSGTPNKALRSFRALIGGQFSSDPAPITPAIPEPAVWAQLIAGFAMVGLAARRRKAGVTRILA